MVEEQTVKVFEVGELDTLAHTKEIGRSAKAIDQHPDVASIQCRQLLVCSSSVVGSM